MVYVFSGFARGSIKMWLFNYPSFLGLFHQRLTWYWSRPSESFRPFISTFPQLQRTYFQLVVLPYSAPSVYFFLCFELLLCLYPWIVFHMYIVVSIHTYIVVRVRFIYELQEVFEMYHLLEEENTVSAKDWVSLAVYEWTKLLKTTPVQPLCRGSRTLGGGGGMLSLDVLGSRDALSYSACI